MEQGSGRTRRLISKIKYSVRPSASEPKQGKVCESPPTLENLPPEIRLHIMSLLQLDGVKALVHASPIYHEQYLRDRKWILFRSLEVTLGGDTFNAYSVYETGSDSFFKKRNLELVEEYMETYKERQYTFQYSHLCLEEVVGMAAFHLSVIEPIARYYANWVLRNFAKKTENSQALKALSGTEEIRLMRALYRFQLCSNLFGACPCDTGQEPFAGLGPETEFVVPIFIRMFNPWETEEIACFYAFVEGKYRQVFDDIRPDVQVNGQWPPGPEGTFYSSEENMRDRLLRGTISRGLKLLHTVLFDIKDHTHLVSTMRANMLPRYDFFDYALSNMQAFGCFDRTLDWEVKQDRGDLMLFQGDKVPDPNGEYPSLAWVLIWNERFHSLSDCFINDEFRRWGYVLWDAARLEGTIAEYSLRLWGRH